MFAVGDNVLFSRSGAIHAGRVHSLGPKGMCKVKVGGHLVSMFEDQLSLDYKRGPRLAPEVDAHREAMMNKEFDEELALTYSLARKLNIERDDLAKWKDAMLKVESQWSDQAVARELGLPVGTNIREGIMPAIQKLKRKRDELREALDALTLVVGLTPIAGNKEVLQDAMNLARKVLKAAKP